MSKSVAHIWLMLIILLGFGNSYAQTLDEIKKESDKYFENEEFLKAKKGFVKLVSSQDYKLDPDVLFKFGTCLIYSKGDEKAKAIAYLNQAIKNPTVDHRAYYYLGKAYHLNYQFDLALKHYNKFKQMATTAELKKINVDADIKACKYGKKLLTNVTDIIVIEKNEIKAQDFYELYKLNDFGGNIIVTDQFQSKYDKKVGHRPVIHFPQNSPYIFYSSYGQDGSTGLDIYVQKKLPNGQWALPQKIQGGVNTNLDENYPYMSPDGQYLYFSSKGHNSMGGYDVFRSKYNAENNTFSAPENMDFAISSPDDDIFYVVDSLDRMAYFSSKRASEQGKIMVYKVRVEKIPMQFAVIKGSFIDEITSSNKSIEFVINDFNNGAEIGTYKSKSKNGDFLITFPKSGKYTFTMTVNGRDISHQAVVDIPYLREFRPLKMRVTHFNDPVNGETIKVEPLFDELFENPTAILAEVYKEMSELKPNADKFDLDSLDKMRETDQIFVDAGLDPYVSKSDVEKVIEDRVDDLENRIEENRENSNTAYHLAKESYQKAEKLINEAEELISQANNENNSDKKNELFQQAYVKKEQAIKLKKQSENYVQIAENIQKETVKLNQNLVNSKQTLLEVKSTPEGDRIALTKAVENNQGYFKNQVKNVDNTSYIEKLEKDANKNQTAYSKINDELVQLNSKKSQLEKENKNLKIDYENAKKKKEKQRLEKIINSNESELELIQQTIQQKEKQLKDLDKDTDSIALIAATKKVVDPAYDNINYTKDLTNDEIATIRNNSKNQTIESKISKIDKVLTDNNFKAHYVSLTGLDESRTDLTVNEWKTAYDNEINAQKEKLSQTIDPIEKEKIKGEIIRLEKAKNDKIKGTTISETSTTTINEYDLIDDYEQRKNQIDNTSNEKTKRIKQNELNKELLNKIEYERIQIKKQLDNNPGDKALQNKLQNLNTMYDRISKNTDENNKWLNGEVVSNQTTVNTQNIIEKAYPNYGQKIDDIYTSDLSSDEKQKQINQLNTTVLNNVEEKIQETKAILENDPNNQQAKDELEQYQNIKNKIQNNPNQAVVEPNTIENMAEVTSKVTKDEILTNYTTNIEKINNSNLSDLDKAKEKQELNKILLKKINKQIQEIERTLENKADDENINKKSLEKRLKNLQNIKNEVTEEINQTQEIIDENSDISTTNLTVENINPNYVPQMLKIENISNETEKTQAITKLNQETITIIENKLNEIGADPNRQKEKEDLTQLKQHIQNNITQANDSNELNRRYGNLSAKVTTTDVLQTYDADLTNINNSPDNEATKSQRKIDLNNTVITKIDRELSGITTYLQNNPTAPNQKTLQKRIINLEKLKAEKSAENKEYQSVIDLNPTEVSTTNLTVENINPNYVPQMLKIENISNETEKTQAITKLNQETITIIENKLNEIGADPNRQKEKEDLTQLKQHIQNNITQANDSNELNRRYGNLSAKVTTTDVLQTYDADLTNINNSPDNEATKSQRKIDLNNTVITKIDRELSGITTYLQNNPTAPNQKTLQKRIINLEKLKAEKSAENKEYQSVIDKNTPLVAITVNNLVPDYDQRKQQIDQSNQSTESKIKAQNELNNELVEKIDLKIEELEDIKLAQPDNKKEIEEQISKLNELKELKLNEIEHNNEILSSLNSTSNNLTTKIDDVKNINQDNFSTEKGKSTYVFIAPDIEKVKTIDNEIDQLNTQKENASEKEIKKINKQIEKKQIEKTKLENKIIENLEEANVAEVEQLKNENITNSTTAKSFGQPSDDIKQADDMVTTANQKIKQAQVLRNEAKTERDPTLANNKLKRAIMLEEEAKTLYNNANLIYKTEVVTNQITSNTTQVILDVPSNTEQRKSTYLFNQAKALELQANYFEQRATELKDSVETVKKKHKQAILIQAQDYENKANQTRTKSTQLKQKATDIQKQEQEILATVPNQTNKTVSKKETEELTTTKTYKFYYGSIKQGNENMAKAKAIEQQIEEKKKQSKRIIKQAIVVQKNSSTIQTNPEITKLQTEIDSLKKLQETYKNKALQNYADAKRILEKSNLTNNSKENIIALANNNQQPKEKQENPLTADFTPPTKLNQDIFRTTNTPAYNTVKDIPVDAQQPEGLVYKVQIGAFRNQPRKEYFDKFAPISGQTINNGITRYMVGYFTTFNKANTAKTQVRGMGDYKDAFVVAYYNGQRITMAKAKQIEAGGVVNQNNQFVVNDTQTNPNTIENTTTENNTTNNNQNTPTTTPTNTSNITVTPTTNQEKQLTSYYTKNSNVAPANQVEIMKGLFFTVQIGVYSNPVPLSVLFNTQPLNSQLTNNQKIRYTTGIYNSVSEANIRKQEIINKGITDAFVTAYYNGKRITIAEATQILNQQGQKVLFINQGQGANHNNTTPTTPINNQTTQTQPQNTNQQTQNNNTNQNTNNTTQTKKYDPQKVYYKVLIGTFTNKVPTEYNKYIFNDNDVTYEPQLENNKIYLLSSKLETIGQIKETITELDELGLENIEIITYYNNQIIPFSQGQNIKNNTMNTELTIYNHPKGVMASQVFYNPEAVYYTITAKFKDEIPINLANIILTYNENDYTKGIDIDGNTVFESKKITTYAEAQKQLKKYKADGFTKAYIKAYYKYTEIGIKKARAIKGE